MSETSREFAPDDLFLEQSISSVHLISHKPIAVCAVKSIDRGKDAYRSRLWTFSLDGSDARCLTEGPGLDTSPRWSPDGRRIAFLSDRDGGKPQLYVIRLDGGEAHRLTQFKLGVQQHAWRPNGSQLLVVVPVAVDPELRQTGGSEPDPTREPRPKDAPELVWRLSYKADGEGYLLGQRVHLFMIALDGDDGPQPLTRGDFDVRAAVWAPSGRRIAFIRTRDVLGEEHRTDLWLLDVSDDGSIGEPRRASREQSNTSSPSWSPDGRRIAFCGSIEDGDAQTRLWLYDVDEDRVQPLGDDAIEVVAGDLQWRPDSRSLTFIQARSGLQEIAVVQVPSGELRSVPTPGRHVVHLAANEQLAFTVEGPTQALELLTASWESSGERALSRLNGWWSERTLPRARLRSFEVPDGDGGVEKIDGWLLTPPDRHGAGPLLVDVHGGPASYVMLTFATHPYWQILCSRGWSILALNAVGSSSYGRDFAARLRARWGELDLPQHQAAVKTLQDEGIADGRVAISGASYGGYLSAWAIGACDLFRAAVVCAPVANLESHYGTSDSGYYADPYSMEGKPEANRTLMAQLSPMLQIERACTPTLFLQGKEDERCPLGQSEELFVKLKSSGGASTEMVLYPGGSHHVFGQGRPSHRFDVVTRVVEWLERWIEQPLQRPTRRSAEPVDASA